MPRLVYIHIIECGIPCYICDQIDSSSIPEIIWHSVHIIEIKKNTPMNQKENHQKYNKFHFVCKCMYNVIHNSIHNTIILNRFQS